MFSKPRYRCGFSKSKHIGIEAKQMIGWTPGNILTGGSLLCNLEHVLDRATPIPVMLTENLYHCVVNGIGLAFENYGMVGTYPLVEIDLPVGRLNKT